MTEIVLLWSFLFSLWWKMTRYGIRLPRTISPSRRGYIQNLSEIKSIFMVFWNLIPFSITPEVKAIKIPKVRDAICYTLWSSFELHLYRGRWCTPQHQQGCFQMRNCRTKRWVGGRKWKGTIKYVQSFLLWWCPIGASFLFDFLDTL